MTTDKPQYSLEQFQERYGLGQAEASRLFGKFGPNKVDLDLLMKGKENHARLSNVRQAQPAGKRPYRSQARPAAQGRSQQSQGTAGA